LIQTLYGTEITKISAGQKHAAAITISGELFTWGKGAHGRLGKGIAFMDQKYLFP
jgi:alpha-tubulin suppressor-like RCC1 family protein